MMKFFSTFIVGFFALFPQKSGLLRKIPTQNVSTISITPSADTQHDVTNLPLGDNKYVTTEPKKGYIYLCRVMQEGKGADVQGPWIQGNTWNRQEKPAVRGSISWPNASFSNTTSIDSRTISGNDLPVHTTTGIFPIQSSDPVYQYDRNPNKITAQTFSLTLPKNPRISNTPNCIQGEVGIMLNGIPLFNGFDAEYRDAPAHEVQDSCDGHPQESGQYHYHSLSRCITDIQSTTVIGFALDGFPITGPVLSNGKYLTSNDLDECHGMTSEVILDGNRVNLYHYVMTEDFPYSISCFRGQPVQMQVIKGDNRSNTNPSSRNQMQNNRQPPQEAISACTGKSSGESCTFSTPRETLTGICQTPPNQTTIICVPNNRP